MLIESLIRLGRVLGEGRSAPGDIIRQVTDITEPRLGEFFRRVYLIEVDEERGAVAVHPSRDWSSSTNQGRQTQYLADPRFATAAPMTLPVTGDRTAAQGAYPVPAYIVYEKHLREMAKSATEARRFLARRMERTRWPLRNPELLAIAAERLKERLCWEDLQEPARAYLLLTPMDESGPYRYGAPPGRDDADAVDLGPSALCPGSHIVANLQRILGLVWEAKAAEGGEHGQLGDGLCSLCRQSGPVVSIYAKVWPWFSTTWEAPLPMELEKDQLVEGVALCPDCYRALNYGAQAFSRVRKAMRAWIAKELFAPVDSATAGRFTRQRENIFASALVLPVLDGFLEDPVARQEFLQGWEGMLRTSPESAPGAVRHLETVTGFELSLPEPLAGDLYRLTLIYYQAQGGDVHLRAVIEDVLPSVASRIGDLLQGVVPPLLEEMAGWRAETSAEAQAFERTRFTSLPYLLIRAYGSAHLWQTLSAVLHRQPISYPRAVRNSARRLCELAHDLEGNHFGIRAEVRFITVFRAVYGVILREIVGREGRWGMRPWTDLQSMLGEQAPDVLRFEDVEELGFAIGHLTRQFSRMYYMATRTGSKGKDFLQHRLMTFGSSLTPETLIRRALARFEEYARRLDMHLPSRFRILCGVLLTECARRKSEIDRNRDGFMVGFWSGYQLQELDPLRGAVADDGEGQEAGAAEVAASA